MTRRTVKTIQLGIRIDNRLVKRIEKLASIEGVTPMSWIRQALAAQVATEERKTIDETIEDYIHLRCDDAEFVRVTPYSTVPEELRKARKEIVAKIKSEAKEK